MVGEAGVGKTAIAEGLAWSIIEGKVPDALKNTVIYSDMGALLLEQNLEVTLKRG